MQVARASALQFNPNVTIVAYHDSVMRSVHCSERWLSKHRATGSVSPAVSRACTVHWEWHLELTYIFVIFKTKNTTARRVSSPPPRGYMTKGDVKVVGGEGDEIPWPPAPDIISSSPRIILSVYRLLFHSSLKIFKIEIIPLLNGLNQSKSLVNMWSYVEWMNEWRKLVTRAAVGTSRIWGAGSRRAGQRWLYAAGG